MRTEMVIRMQARSEKKGHSRAMKIAAETGGVDSVTLAGKDMNLLLVVGDGVDCNGLTTRLRKNVGHADVVGYGNGYGYPAASFAPPTASEYYGRRPAYEYHNYNYSPPSSCSMSTTWPVTRTAAPSL